MKNRKMLYLGLAAFLLVGCGNAQKKADTAEKAQAAEITLTEMTPLADVKTAPEKYVGREVLVEGTVDARCTAMGCWISIIDDGMDEGIIVTTPDESYIFPEETLGKQVQVQGTWTLKNAAEIEAHEADAEGADHDCPNPIYYLNIEAMKVKA